MTSLSLADLVLLPFALAVPFLAWVLWNLTLELSPRQSSAASPRVIPIETVTSRHRFDWHHQGRGRGEFSFPLTSSEVRVVRN
jgi:hypothetical protein